MASLFTNISVLAIFLVISALIVPSSSTFQPQTTQSEIDSICSKTRNATFCQDYLKSDPNVSTANLTGLDHFVLDNAWADAQAVKIELQGLQYGNKVPDPVAFRTYKTCYDQFDRAFYEMLDAKSSLEKGDIKTVKFRGPRAMKAIESCKIELMKLRGDKYVAYYLKRSEFVEDIVSIAIVISSMLPLN